MRDNKLKILTILQKHKVLRVSEFAKFLSHRSLLRRMVDAGELFYIGSGIYAHPSIDPQVAAVIASKYYPNAVVSNVTAMTIHGLSDEVIDQVDLDISRGSSIRNKLFRVHRIPDKRLVGIINYQYRNFRIRIYDKERTLCEAYLLDPNGTLFYKALKRYLKINTPQIETITRYDSLLKTEVLSHLKQELADG